MLSSLLSRLVALSLSALFVFASAPAAAHTGLITSTSGLMAGLTHPLFGLDHFLAMLAVGLWAAQTSGRFIWLAPVSFLGMMLVGGLFGIAFPDMAVFEMGITGSVLFFGLVIASAWAPKPVFGMALCGVFALFHGQAHGAEMDSLASPILYTLGFIAATSCLHMIGITIGSVMQQKVVRFAGAGLSMAGVALLVL